LQLIKKNKKMEGKANILSLKQLSTKYDVSLSRLYKATMRKEFSHFKQGRVYVDEQVFVNWLTSNKVESVEKMQNTSKIPL